MERDKQLDEYMATNLMNWESGAVEWFEPTADWKHAMWCIEKLDASWSVKDGHYVSIQYKDCFAFETGNNIPLAICSAIRKILKLKEEQQ